jgi:hypothetical protein
MSVVNVFPSSKQDMKNVIPLGFNPTLMIAGRTDRLQNKQLIERVYWFKM